MPNTAPKSSKNKYQQTIANIDQITTEGKKMDGFGKNDLNTGGYFRVFDWVVWK